jgi:hypothetical protein
MFDFYRTPVQQQRIKERRARQRKGFAKKRCVICNSEFIPKASRTKSCGPECAKKKELENAKFKRHKHKEKYRVIRARRAASMSEEQKNNRREKQRLYRQTQEYKQKKREYDKLRRQRQDVRDRKRQYNQTSKFKEQQKEYYKKPEIKERHRKWAYDYYRKPEIKERIRDRMRSHENREKQKAYRERCETKKRQRDWARKKKQQERLAQLNIAKRTISQILKETSNAGIINCPDRL